MSFNAIRENKILAKIYEFTVLHVHGRPYFERTKITILTNRALAFVGRLIDKYPFQLRWFDNVH